ncbi:hypothetical protein D9M68_678060 [compost metagenome]
MAEQAQDHECSAQLRYLASQAGFRHKELREHHDDHGMDLRVQGHADEAVEQPQSLAGVLLASGSGAGPEEAPCEVQQIDGAAPFQDGVKLRVLVKRTAQAQAVKRAEHGVAGFETYPEW